MEKFGAGLVWRGSWKVIYLIIALLLLDGIYQSFRDSVCYYNNYPISVITRKFGDYDIETGQQYLYGGTKNSVKFLCSLFDEWDDAQVINDNDKEISVYSKNKNIKITLVYSEKYGDEPKIIIASDDNIWFPYNANQIINFKNMEYHIDDKDKIMVGMKQAAEIKNYIETFNDEQMMTKDEVRDFIKQELKKQMNGEKRISVWKNINY